MAISFACPSCSKQYKVKSDFVGKTVKCPCGETFQVPEPVAEISIVDSEYSGVAGLIEEFGSSANAEKQCPSCKSAMSFNAVLCIECGYHLQKRIKLKTDSHKTRLES